MGKGSTVLGLIGLLLGAGGLALGGFAWLSVSRVENQVSSLSSWFKMNNTVFQCSPPFTYITFSGLTIEFELNLDESVYFSFTCRAHTEPIGGWSRVIVYFRVDGLFVSTPNAEGGTFNGVHTAHFMICLQDVRDDLTPGLHTVTVDIWGDSSANYIYQSTLFIQSFPT